jgi:hypothetical protein
VNILTKGVALTLASTKVVALPKYIGHARTVHNATYNSIIGRYLLIFINNRVI